MGTLGFPPTRLTAVPDKWVRPTRRPADLSVGPTDLVGGPHDLLKTFQKISQTTSFGTTSRLGVQDRTSVDLFLFWFSPKKNFLREPIPGARQLVNHRHILVNGRIGRKLGEFVPTRHFTSYESARKISASCTKQSHKLAVEFILQSRKILLLPAQQSPKADRRDTTRCVT
jgi:hypothetical protein